MSYDAATHFAQTWGLGLAVVLFLATVVYALWPANQGKFDKAARAPLSKDEEYDNA